MPFPSTTLEHFADPLVLRGEARILGVGAWKGTPALVLDRTWFYPESGGQLGDVGTIGDLLVVDTQVDATGVVHHLLGEAPPPDLLPEVTCSVDRARRRLHMALHTGQHLLSRALQEVAGAETVSSRLFGSACTIDTDSESIGESRAAEAEALANRWIEDDVPVRAWFPSEVELRSLPLRRAPSVEERIRVVSIEGFDVSPCGGTHCTRTAQIGPLTVTGLDRAKGKMRVAFLAGRAALSELKSRSDELVALGKLFTTGPYEVRQGIEKLRGSVKEAQESLGIFRAAHVQRLLERILARNDELSADRVIAYLDGETVETLRAVATKLGTIPAMQAVIGVGAFDGVTIIAVKGDSAPFDAGAWLGRLAKATGGRGGGRPERAEGRWPAGADFWSLAQTP